MFLKDDLKKKLKLTAEAVYVSRERNIFSLHLEHWIFINVGQ